MAGAIAIVFVASAIAALLGTELLRSMVHRRRERRTGIGGTQDIAMWGTFLSGLLLAGAVVSGLIWFFSR